MRDPADTRFSYVAELDASRAILDIFNDAL